MSRPSTDVIALDGVDRECRQQVLALAAAAAAVDDVVPLDDQVQLDLVHPTPEARHLIVRLDDHLVAYAHLNLSDPAVASGHLVVHPSARRRGIGARLASAMAHQAGAGLRVWSHGDLPAARGFAAAQGFLRVRELWQMAGPLSADLPPPTYADGISVRTFEPELDQEAWVAVNAAAFSDHPEQGRMTVDDLRQRMAEPWFDPRGFFLAERDGVLLGFHWTKTHGSRPGHPGRVGEVYVLGVAPDAQGLGLGTALTTTGLRHLRGLGLETVILYVEGSNTPAIAVYEKLGLSRVAVDVMYELRGG